MPVSMSNCPRGRRSVLNRRRKDKPKQVPASDAVYAPRGAVLIDGYNLMHATRFKPQGNAEDVLRRSREGLLDFLAQQLPNRFAKSTIVFDSHRRLRHRPAEQRWQQLEVHFARDHASADELLGELIRGHSPSQPLVVVSSDHQVQRMALRRGAMAIDSDDWFDALLQPREEAGPETMSNLDQQIEAQAQEDLADEDWGPMVANDSLAKKRVDHPFPEGYFDDLEGG